MTANQKSVTLGILLFAIAVTSAVYLIKRGPPAQGEVILETSQPEIVRGADQPATNLHARQEWAADFQKKMKARNYTIRVMAADPPDHRRLLLRWGRDQTPDDREHMDNLQRLSEPFYEKLRRLGFKRVEMYLEQRQVWRKAL
jgi:hypothetical protein